MGDLPGAGPVAGCLEFAEDAHGGAQDLGPFRRRELSDASASGPAGERVRGEDVRQLHGYEDALRAGRRRQQSAVRVEAHPGRACQGERGRRVPRVEQHQRPSAVAVVRHRAAGGHTQDGDGALRCRLRRRAVPVQTVVRRVFARVHPDGDELVLLRTDSGDPYVTARLPLPAMDGAPRPGGTPWDGVQRRAIAASPGSPLVAVTRGGHGEIHLIDADAAPGASSPVTTVKVPTPLNDGGHLALVCPGDGAHGDPVGR